MEKYVDQYVWLSCSGGVVGFTLKQINDYIDFWNRDLYKTAGSFWEWLSYEEGYRIHGFSVLWHSKLLSKVHRIRGYQYA